MSTLVLAESVNGALLESTAKLVTAARAFNDPITLLVIDHDAGNIAQEAAQIGGVSEVRVATVDEPDLLGLDEIAGLMQSLAPHFNTILATDSGQGRHILPLLAANLEYPPLTGVSAIKGAGIFERPIHSGALVEEVHHEADKILVTIRATSFSTAGQQAPCPIVPLTIPSHQSRIEVIERTKISTGRPDLANAPIVVAGGRGLGSKENFQQLEQLADQMGAALGASRIAVDMGWAPHMVQVGQTGTKIAPRLYIALGISGAVQHLAGIKEAETIVVINKDEEAPLFKVADYGLVGDVNALMSELQTQLATSPEE